MQNQRFIVIILVILFAISKITIYIVSERRELERSKYFEYLDGYETLDKQLQRKFSVQQEGNYMIMQNYIQANDNFPYNESMTYTTHGTYKDLHLLEDLLETWHAPVSMAIFANGPDLNRTLNRIFYLRECSKYNKLVRYFVTFHICMHQDHMPAFIPNLNYEFRVVTNCTAPRWSKLLNNNATSYWQEQHLEYPMNLLRNIARRTAWSYYVFPLELIYEPMGNFSRNFLDVISSVQLQHPTKSVFCIPISEKVDTINTATQLTAELSDKNSNYIEDELLYYEQYSKAYIQNKSSNKSYCDASNYVRIVSNTHEPFYDDHILLECAVSNVTKSEITDVLQYDYIILGGTVVKRRGELEHLQTLDETKINEKKCKRLYKTTRKQWKLLFSY